MENIVRDNTFFLDNLFEILLDIESDFYNIISQFLFLSEDENGKTRFDYDESPANIRLNQLILLLKERLNKFIGFIELFINDMDSGTAVRYISDYVSTEDINDLVKESIAEYHKRIRFVLPQFRPVIDSCFSIFLLLICRLNTAIREYNETETGGRYPLLPFETPGYMEQNPAELKTWFNNARKIISVNVPMDKGENMRKKHALEYAIHDLDEAVGQYLILLYHLHKPQQIQPSVEMEREEESVDFDKKCFEPAMSIIFENIDIVIGLLKCTAYTKDTIEDSNDNLIELALDIQDVDKRVHVIKPEFQEQLSPLHSGFHKKVEELEKSIALYNRTAEYKLFQMEKAIGMGQQKIKRQDRVLPFLLESAEGRNEEF